MGVCYRKTKNINCPHIAQVYRHEAGSDISHLQCYANANLKGSVTYSQSC